MRKYLHLIYESLGPLFAVAVLLTIIVGLAACGGNGWSLPWSRGATVGGDAPAADPFGNLWWIAPAGILCGIAMIGLLGMRREGIITALASIALVAALAEGGMTTILLLAGWAVAYLLGNGQNGWPRGARGNQSGGPDEATALSPSLRGWKSYGAGEAAREVGMIKPMGRRRLDDYLACSVSTSIIIAMLWRRET
jgi:hypothetical protein